MSVCRLALLNHLTTLQPNNYLTNAPTFRPSDSLETVFPDSTIGEFADTHIYRATVGADFHAVHAKWVVSPSQNSVVA
jgi:hypothetical protein